MTTPQHPFDLVILDLDGTILNPYEAIGIHQTVKQTIANVQAAGIPVTIGTGRTLDMVRPYAAQLNVTQPVVTTQGAVIADPVSGQVLAETVLPLAAARAVAEWVDDTQRVTVFYIRGADGKSTIYQNRNGLDKPNQTLELYDHIFGAPRVVQPRFAALLAAPDAHTPVKFMTVNDPEHEENIEPALQQQFGNDLYITRTHPILVEGTALGISKGDGVRKLCKIMGIDPQRVLAIGDADNDISMLEVAGVGVAMGNGSAGTKAVADWIAPTIAEDGAAVALQKFVLDRR